MIATFAVLIVTTGLLAILIAWRRRHFSYFEDLGVPGPKPNLIWGNFLEYYQDDRYKVIGKWLKKYGDVFGFYNGDVPFLVVNDLDFLEYVFVRKFGNFVDRGLTMLTDQMHPILGKSILHAKGNDWKSIRSSVNYGLSAAKIKMMMPEVCKSADLFLERMEKLANDEVHSYDEYQLLSMDYTARGAFGIDTVFQLEPHHPLLTIAKGVLDGVMTGPLHMIAQCTTALGDIMKPFYFLVASFGEFTFKNLGEETSKIVELRRKDPSLRRPDMLQNLIDATMPTEDDYGSMNEENRTDEPAPGDDLLKTLSFSLLLGVRVRTSAVGEATGEPYCIFFFFFFFFFFFLPTAPNRGRHLSNEEVFTTATTLFMAGFDTTGTALSYVTFFIAKHQDVQKKVRRELRDALADGVAKEKC
nr:putative cytochrome P450 CYP13A10 [Dermacentor andersoni]